MTTLDSYAPIRFGNIEPALFNAMRPATPDQYERASGMASAAMPAASTDRGHYAPLEAFVTSPKKIFFVSVKTSSFRAVSAALARRRGERYQ
jgi:hypothetical protein